MSSTSTAAAADVAGARRSLSATGRAGRRAVVRLPRNLLPTFVSLVLVLVVWELLSRAGAVSELVAGRPSSIVGAGVETVRTPSFWRHLLVSGRELAIGFALALVIGIPCGLAAGWYRALGYMVAPWLDAFNAIPRIALLPLIVIWLGIGDSSKVTLVFISAVGLIMLNTYVGVRTVDATLIEVGEVFGAGALRRFRSIVLPSTMPFVLAGVRTGLGAAIVGVIFAESYGANEGLGYFMQISAQSLQVERYFFLVFVFTALGAVCFGLLALVERRMRRHTEQKG